MNDNNFSLPQHDTGNAMSIMMEQECTTYACHDYLNESAGRDRDESLPRCDRVTPDDRMKLVDWCYGIVDQCQFDRECVAVAMNIADRFMSARGHRPQEILHDRGQYQLLIMSALYIAIKISERSALGSEDFSTISRGTYSKEDVESMELAILRGLEWRLSCPTALQIGYHIVDLMLPQVQDASRRVNRDTWDFLRQEMAFQTENAVRGHHFTTQRSSTIAAVSILSAIEKLNDIDYQVLMNALISVMKEFDFDSQVVMLDTWDRLKRLVKESEGSLDGPTPEEELVSEACHYSASIVFMRIQNKLEGTVSYSEQALPSRSYFMDDGEEDDDSCATVY